MKSWCVYFLIRSKKVVYVGVSSNLPVRMIEHLGNKNFTSVRWIKCLSKPDAFKYEKRWTKRFRPEYNTHKYLRLERFIAAGGKPTLPEYIKEMVTMLAEQEGRDIQEILNSPEIDSFKKYEV